MNINKVLSGEKVLSDSEKGSISLTAISSAIKQQLKKEYPACKFSVTSQFYSGGCSLHIAVMETDFKAIMPFNEINQLKYSKEDLEDIKTRQESKSFQISSCAGEYNPNNWNNGVFLTEQGFNLIKRITELTNKFNYDNSDSQIDYFNVNFYLSLSFGKYNKPFIEGLK
jgi:hypothetical protein